MLLSLVDGSLIPHIAATFQAVLVGFALALIVGIAIGSLLGASHYWREVLEPILDFVQNEGHSKLD